MTSNHHGATSGNHSDGGLGVDAHMGTQADTQAGRLGHEQANRHSDVLLDAGSGAHRDARALSCPSPGQLPPKIVLASDNAGKLREFSALFAPLGTELVTQGSLGVRAAEEPFHTFLENALTKARHASAQTGLPALADDSGLCVDALGGAPGVYSARFSKMAGREAGDQANNALLLQRMAGETNRRGSYVAVLVYVRHAEDPWPILGEGVWRGEILTAPQGEGGFGYDPLFYLSSQGQTAAQLSAAEKNRVSHRARALAMLLDKLAQARAA